MNDPESIPRPQCASVFVCVGILVLQKSIKKYSYTFFTAKQSGTRTTILNN